MASVVLVSHGFQPNYEKAFANGLARNGLSVTMAVYDRTLVNELEPSIRKVRLRGSQDPARPLLSKAWALLAYTFRLYAFISVNRKKALHLTGIFLTASVPLGLLEVLGYRLLSRKLLMTVHNLQPHDKHSWLNRKLLHLIYSMPDRLVVHTKKMRDALVNEWHMASERIVVMEHGVDDLPADPSPWRPDPDGRLRLLMFGSVARYKGIDLALESLMDFKDFSVALRITGPCRDDGLASEIYRLIDHTPHLHQVAWKREFVKEEDVKGIFEQADAVLLPYRHIDQSGVLLTAYRFGIPVLAFDVGSFGAYIKPETGILITDRSVSGLQHGMRTLQARLNQFDRETIRSFARHYLWEHTTHVLLPYYS